MPRLEIDYLRVAPIEMAIFGRSDHFENTPFEQLPFCAPAIPVTGSAVAMRGLDGWPDDRFPRNVQFATDMLESALDLARRGLGVVYIPNFVAALHNRIVQSKFALQKLPVPKDPSLRRREVFLVKRKSSEESDDAKRISKILREVCRLDA